MELKQIDYLFARIESRILPEAFTPVNTASEMKKSFVDENYNPVFEYKKYPFDLAKMRKSIEAVQMPKGELARIFIAKKNELLNKIELLENIGKNKFGAASLKLYGAPSRELVRKANAILSRKTNEKKSRIAENPAHLVKNALKKYRINWKVETAEIAAGAMVDQMKKTVYLQKGARYSDEFVKRLIVHEIKTHVFRAENGRMQPWKIFLYGFPDYLATEEGLAVFNEEKASLLTDESLRSYAGRVVAVELALRGSFSQVYKKLLKFFPREKAWMIAMRVKRGLGDTSMPGGYTKDHIYLDGYYKVKEFARKNEILRLYYGKIGIKDLRSMRFFDGLKKPNKFSQ